MDNVWLKTPEEALRYFNVGPEKGLSKDQVEENRKKYGSNEMQQEEGTPFWKLVLEQFEDQLVRILLLAAIISFVLACFEEGDRLTAFVEPLVILLILIANATVGVLQEQKAEASIEALKQYEADSAVVVRDGNKVSIPSADLVPGDIVEVAVGQSVPAELRILDFRSVSFRVDQSMLTGESVSVPKEAAALTSGNNAFMVQDKHNVLFKGTNVVLGRARGIVFATGMNTEMGKISTQLHQKEEIASPLQKKLDEFGDQLSKVITVICVLVWLINIGHFWDPEHGGVLRGAVYYFKVAVALAVAAIPEGLPAVVTTCLALGTQKMARQNAIVRSLPAVETLGCTTVICSDKTGTLTTNKMSIRHVVVAQALAGKSVDLRILDVDGSSFDPTEGAITLKGAKQSPADLKLPAYQTLAAIGSLCNEGSIAYDESTRQYDRVGEPTEVAIKVLAEKLGTEGTLPAGDSNNKASAADRAVASARYWSNKYKKLATLEFSRDRKSMSVLVSGPEGNQFFVKGAPENVLARSNNLLLNNNQVVPLTPELRSTILAQVSKMAGDALRCIAFARIDNAKKPEEYNFSEPSKFAAIESNMTFVGVVGMFDPPRPEVAPAIQTCREAGIRVIVITGDNKLTAESIGRRIGIFSADEDLSKGRSYTGEEFDRLTPDQQQNAVRTASLFSRTEPIHKSRLVNMLRSQNEVVAMTGDGVNDAPALKAADIGIAMGSGTAVAKGASKMVLADDNFATIVGAVREGRAIYNNTKQFIRYLISSNIGEVVCIFLTAALGLPEALVPVQLLWVNLVTDGLPATALGFNPPEQDLMKRKPRGSDDPIINGWMFFRYFLIGLYVGVATVGGAFYWYTMYPGGPQLSWSQLLSHHQCPHDGVGTVQGIDCQVFRSPLPATISLSILVTIEMFNALNSVSENQSIFSMPPYVNPWLIGAVILSFALHFLILYVPFLANVFAITSLAWAEWKIVLIFSAPVIVLDEILKFVSRIAGVGQTNSKKVKSE